MMPLDMHAHIEPAISALEVKRLGACVVAVTRSLDEYETVLERKDPNAVWGVGCHPGMASAVKAYSHDRFRRLLSSAVFVGEVGLDANARVPLDRQQAVFDDVIRAVVAQPRIVSVHSYRATRRVLETLREHRPAGIVLHWWLGDEDDTRAAVDLGAYFSVNASQVRRWDALKVVPRNRLLTETDHPFGDRREAAPRRPGNVAYVERDLGSALGISADETRRLVWRNLQNLVGALGLVEQLPHQFQVQLLAA